MGWCGGDDPMRHVELHLPNREAAIGYAIRHGIPYEVSEPHEAVAHPALTSAKRCRVLKSWKWDGLSDTADRKRSLFNGEPSRLAAVRAALRAPDEPVEPAIPANTNVRRTAEKANVA
jgi:hypothetical protein